MTNPIEASESGSHGQDDEVRRGRERFQLAARVTQDLLWEWDLDLGHVIWAGTTRPYFGLPPEQISSVNGNPYLVWADRVHPDDLAGAEQVSRVAIQGRAESWDHEYRFLRGDGTYALVSERAFIARDEMGRARWIVGAIRDVSGRKETERDATRLAAIVASSTDAIIGKSLEGIVTTWNAAAERIFGYSEREMVGNSIFVLIPEELHEDERTLLRRIAAGERVDFADAVRIRKDGSRIYIALTVTPIWDSSGVVVGASSIKRDITDRKRADADLARREERYRALVVATSTVVWIANPAGEFDAPQESWQAYTGQPWAEHRDLGWMEAIHGDDRAHAAAGWLQARSRRAIWEGRPRIWSQAHHGYRHCVVRAVPLLAADGEVREWMGTVTDAEERWLADERLRQADRMESVGRLAGGVAHEANNQMTVILGAAEFLDRAVRDELVRMDLEHIRRAAHRTAVITQQLLAFSRRQVLQPQLVNLNSVISAIEPILQRALGELSRLELRLAPDIGQVRADPGQLDQVLLNLALNARDAMPDGGTVTIETMNVGVDEHAATARGVDPVAPGRYAALAVSDTGTGMDRETLDHIFEPFFTTKAVGEGTGLGLATVYGIVRQSGGYLSVTSQLGRGSAFQIYLPLVGADAPRDHLHAPDPSPVGGPNSFWSRRTSPPCAVSLPARCAVTAIPSSRPPTAPKRWRSPQTAPAPPDLVIADVVMPGMGGKQLAAALEERWPGIPGALHLGLHRCRYRPARTHGGGTGVHAEAAGTGPAGDQGAPDPRRPPRDIEPRPDEVRLTRRPAADRSPAVSPWCPRPPPTCPADIP